jgi:hypothetical protein
MSNVLFRYTDQVSVFIGGLQGRLQPTAGHPSVDFNHPESFVIAVQGARMSMTVNQLSALMNNYLLNSPKAQIKNVSITANGDHLVMKGTMRKGLHVPFEATVAVGITRDNRVRFDVQQMKSMKIPVKGLMDVLGVDLGDLISQKGLKGISVDKDSFLVDPQTAFPAPQMRGTLTGVQVSARGIVMVFGDGAPKLDKIQGSHNFIALRGGVLRYGRDEMSNADLTMLDTSPADPLDFYLRRYTRQLAGGTIKATNDMALQAYIPDFAKLDRTSH